MPEIRRGTTAKLLAIIESEDVEVIGEWVTVQLPARGDARRPARFILVPKRACREAGLDVKILYQFNQIESLVVRAIAPRATPDSGKLCVQA